MSDITQTAIDMDALGFDAKVLAGSSFGMGMKTSVTLMQRESHATARTQAAFDELVERGVVAVEPYNEFGGLVYRPLVDCGEAFRWLHAIIMDESRPELKTQASWQLYEPIDENQAYDLMTPFGKGVWDKERRGLKPKDNPYDATTQADDHARWRKGHRCGGR